MQPKYLTPRQLASSPSRPGRWPFSAGTMWRKVGSGELPPFIHIGAQIRALPLAEAEAIEAAWAAGKTGEQLRATVRELVAARTKGAAR